MITILSYEQPFWLLISASFCLFIFIFLLEHFRKIALRYESESDIQNDSRQSTNGECSSPECIRCNKTKKVLECGQQKLSLYSKENGLFNKDEISALMKDIQQSLSRISRSEDVTNLCSDIEHIASTPNVLFIRGLREQSIVSRFEFSGLNVLIDNYNQIKLEFMHLYQSPLPETKAMWKVNTTDKGKWEIAQLIDQGCPTRASQLCPLTMNFLGQISSVMRKNVFGNAAFSLVHPNTFIERHSGSTNCRIRCHLGLQIPFNCCTLEVGSSYNNWKEGHVICFNDAFPHSVAHTGHEDSGPRVILMVDLWHPDITESQRKLIDFAFSSEDARA